MLLEEGEMFKRKLDGSRWWRNDVKAPHQATRTR